jgi:hypothetical protein
MVATYTKGIEESKATWADAGTVMECVFAVSRSRGDSDYIDRICQGCSTI